MSDQIETTEKETVKTASKKIAPVKKGVKIEFTASPTFRFNLGYNIGDTAQFDKKQAEILIDAGVAKKA